MNKKDLFLECKGKVVQKLPDGYFKVEILKGSSKLIIIASIANRLKRTNKGWSKTAEGDEIKVEVPLGGSARGRIIELLD